MSTERSAKGRGPYLSCGPVLGVCPVAGGAGTAFHRIIGALTRCKPEVLSASLVQASSKAVCEADARQLELNVVQKMEFWRQDARQRGGPFPWADMMADALTWA